MDNIKFISSGLLGDFIQSLFAVKNICEVKGVKADLYLCNDCHGDVWTYGIEKAYTDLKELILAQSYINSFQILHKDLDTAGFINLNLWREDAANEFVSEGEYMFCWSERLANKFSFKLPTKENYKWLVGTRPEQEEPPDSFYRTKGKIVIHRSKHRHSGLPWNEVLDKFKNEIVFVTTNANEYYLFRDKFGISVPHIVVNTISELTNLIAPCKLFIGNQSAPFSIANALDVPRLGELEAGVWKFYKDEINYSSNISYYMSNEFKYFTPNSIIKL